MKQIITAYFQPIITAFLFLICFSTATFGQVVINEIVASNQNGLLDEDGDHPDWIELYNTGDAPIDLSGYGISDDAEDPFQWTISDITLETGGYYLLFASDKDREGHTAYWETIVRQGDDTQYLVPSTSVSSDWILPAFDDSAWETGPFGIGYGDEDDATVTSSGILSIFTRTTFTIDDAENIASMMLHIDFDDGYIAYLNGVEISRENMDGEAPQPHNAVASIYTEPLLAFGEELPAISLNDFTDLLETGENVLAIQVHNNSTTSSDITLIPFLSVGHSTPPEETRDVAGETNLNSTAVNYPHTNFKLSADGENITLINPFGITEDEITFPALNMDESYGRPAGNPASWALFDEPTPLEENAGEGFEERLSVPELTNYGGFYSGSIEIEISTGIANNIYYTTDGNDPTSSSDLFESSLLIDETTTVKLRAIEEGKLSSNIETQTYFIDAEHDLPVISLVTPPDNLWSDESGIYVEGTNGIEGNCTGARNWNQDWEIPAHIELYENGGSPGFSSNIGAKIFGGCSRNNSQKSLAVFFRGEYGNPELEYRLFEEKEIDIFESFVLRNSGNDFNDTHFRDALMKTLIEDTEIDYQAYQPVVVYLNGEYYGIHNIREKINEHFIASNHGVDTDDIDLIENNGFAKHGSTSSYDAFMNALESADMQNQDNYNSVLQHVDLDNYIDYMAAQIFYVNRDWPGNNLRYWKEKNGKFRWILYDTDFGFNMYGGHPAHINMLNFATAKYGPEWPNPHWSTHIFRKFLESESFEQAFINRFGDLLNTVFEEDHIISVIDSLAQGIDSEMAAHKSKWWGSKSDWHGAVGSLRNFARSRPDYMESHIESFFNVGERKPVTVNVSHSARGSVQVNRIIPDEYPWTGDYFGDVPVEITAIPNSGYTFGGWSGASTSTERKISIESNNEPNLTANFTPSTASASDIVINEIMYNAADDADSDDWIELYNSAGSSFNVSGWVVKDDDNQHEFIIPDNTIIDSQGYLVIVVDQNMFDGIYSNIGNVIGELGFGLSGSGDQVRIFDETGELVDSVEYDDVSPWDSQADGNGHSLELKDPFMDNSIAESWSASIHYKGSPGTTNGESVSNETEEELPSSINLGQNYPNPFNPSTNIRFELPEKAQVKLTIYDVLGRKVTVLENGILTAGTYNAKWDAGALASGIYIYRLEVDQQTFTKKMLLAK
ncbi:MAG: CotH kinase family protein [Balneolaceae bacterium]